MFKKIYIITSIYLICAIPSSFSYMINVQDLIKKSVFIQIGALKRESSLKELIKKFKKYPLYIERDQEINRVFIVYNGSSKKIKPYLKKIHKITPDAFVKKNFIPIKKDKIVIKKVQKDVNKRYFDDTLNSEAILRTRKKFF